jgi:hypothetical protein
MELNLDGKIARMFSTVTTVATAHDVALQELHVEAFYPADAATELLLQTYQRYYAKPAPWLVAPGLSRDMR